MKQWLGNNIRRWSVRVVVSVLGVILWCLFVGVGVWVFLAEGLEIQPHSSPIYQNNCQINIQQIDPDISPHYLVDVALAFESEFTVCIEIPGREMVSEEE